MIHQREFIQNVKLVGSIDSCTEGMNNHVLLDKFG